jgi:hypothetical protein
VADRDELRSAADDLAQRPYVQLTVAVVGGDDDFDALPLGQMEVGDVVAAVLRLARDYPVAGLLGRLVATDLALELKMGQYAGEDRLGHERRAGVVEVDATATPRRLGAAAGDVHRNLQEA